MAFSRGPRDRQHEAALSAFVKVLPMTTNNRQRKYINSNGDNPPGPAHENALTISDNADVGVDYRTRKSSCSENGVGGGSSCTAFQWLQQSALVSVVPWLLDPRHLSPEPPCDAHPGVRRPASGQVPIHALDASCKLLQSFPGPVRRVRRMPLVSTSVRADPAAHADAESERIKSAGALEKTAKKRPYGFVNGNSPGVFMPATESYHRKCLW